MALSNAAKNSLIQARDAAAANLAALELQGPTQGNVNYNIDGRSYDFVGAKDYWKQAVKDLTDTIQQLEGPWIVRSRSQ